MKKLNIISKNKFYLLINEKNLHLLIIKFFLLISILFIIINLTFEIYTGDIFIKDIKTIQKDNSPRQLTWENVNKTIEFYINKYTFLIKKEKKINKKSPIWMLWFQGIENAPPIVKACIQSVKKNSGGHKVHVLSKNDLEKYIKLPEFIIQKFKNKIISFAHLSDIIRMGLLYKYGGYWIDATYFLTTPLKKISTKFFSIKLDYCWTYTIPFIKCLFSINFIALPKHSFIAGVSYISLINYWKYYNDYISYFLLDYIFHFMYLNVTKVKQDIYYTPSVSCDIFSLYSKLNKAYKKSDFNCPFHKLNKRKKNFTLYNKKNKLTNFGYILSLID